MARRRTPQDTLKEAVERTVQAGQGTAERAQGSVDELVQVTRERASTAVGDLAQRAASVRGALEAGRPATHEDIRELRKELRAIGRRLEKIEERLPKKSSKKK